MRGDHGNKAVVPEIKKMTNKKIYVIEKTNKEMQEICDHSDDYCPIDANGNLQGAVCDTTAYIVDIGMGSDLNEDEAYCIYDRQGENKYVVSIVPWW